MCDIAHHLRLCKILDQTGLIYEVLHGRGGHSAAFSALYGNIIMLQHFTHCVMMSSFLCGTEVESRRLFDTPVRVFHTVPGTGAQLCDYMFQDEKTEEVTKRIKELTDLTVSAEDLEMTCEHPASKLSFDIQIFQFFIEKKKVVLDFFSGLNS